METVNKATNERLVSYPEGIKDATEETLAGYIVGFSEHKNQWYISPHGDEVEEIRNAIGNRLKSMAWKDQTKFFEEQGVNRGLWDEWRVVASLFTTCKESVSTFTGDSGSFPSFPSSLRILSSSHDGRSLISGSNDRGTEAG
jgi:hypothetical protein